MDVWSISPLSSFQVFVITCPCMIDGLMFHNDSFFKISPKTPNRSLQLYTFQQARTTKRTHRQGTHLLIHIPRPPHPRRPSLSRRIVASLPLSPSVLAVIAVVDLVNPAPRGLPIFAYLIHASVYASPLTLAALSLLP